MIAKFLYKNLRWQFNKQPFEHLLAPAATETQYLEQLAAIAGESCPQTRAIDTAETEFCLNRLILSRPSNHAQKAALGYSNEFWQQFIRLKALFGKKFLLFPANGHVTRVERIAELLCKCTQFAVDGETEQHLAEKTYESARLTEREKRYFKDVVRLYKIKYYCAATESLAKHAFAEPYAARFLQPELLRQDFAYNRRYSQAAYSAKQIASVVDCMGNSALRLGDKNTHVQTKLFVYANGRNVFDTFVQSRFGNRQAQFVTETESIRLDMRYFLHNNSEVRNVAIVNKGKCARKFTVQIPFGCAVQNASYFRMGGALCLATDVFVTVAVLHNGVQIECRGEREQTFDVQLAAGKSYSFDVVTVAADNSPAIADALAESERFGAARCPYLWDEACTRLTFGASLKLSPHGYTAMKTPPLPAQQLKYSYQLGDCDVATFWDNNRATTLLKGFVFGVKGESVFSVRNGMANKLNEQSFRLDGDKLIYEKKSGKLCISHNGGKVYRVQYDKAARTLFYFPTELKSQIRFDDKRNCFDVEDGERQYTVKCAGRVESFTSDALECNEEKLRYKLSNDLAAGNCLAICFAPATEVSIELVSATVTPEATPIVRESLVSTYLNYVNDKNVFCFNNRLKRPDCLSVAALCYTNPSYVRDLLEEITEKGSATRYYDAAGTKREFDDRMTLPLAAIYYMNLVDKLSDKIIKMAHGVLFCETTDDKELCIKALALLKAAKLDCFDRVKCLVEYSKLKKQICTDSKLFAYAQAIGAIPMLHPSKERLKDLCNKYEISQSWYYVSQLENLYGLSISAGKLQIAPTVTAENVLEQFALNIAGKRIDTTFAKASVRCMTLNGQQCFSPFYAPSLKNEQNQLVVSY